jgi:hypothetical protein
VACIKQSVVYSTAAPLNNSEILLYGKLGVR